MDSLSVFMNEIHQICDIVTRDVVVRDFVTRDTTHICMAGILEQVTSRLHVCRDRYYLAIHHDGDLSASIFFSLLSLKEYTKAVVLTDGYKTLHYPWSRKDVVDAIEEPTIEKDQDYFQRVMPRERGVTLFCPWNNSIWEHLQKLLPLFQRAYPNVDITIGSD